jgi:hypothetical protein
MKTRTRLLTALAILLTALPVVAAGTWSRIASTGTGNTTGDGGIAVDGVPLLHGPGGVAITAWTHIQVRSYDCTFGGFDRFGITFTGTATGGNGASPGSVNEAPVVWNEFGLTFQQWGDPVGDVLGNNGAVRAHFNLDGPLVVKMPAPEFLSRVYAAHLSQPLLAFNSDYYDQLVAKYSPAAFHSGDSDLGSRLVSMDISGVTGYFHGQGLMAVFTETQASNTCE